MGRWFGMAAVWVCLASIGFADDWPHWLGPKRDAVWREDGILETFPKDGPKRRWRTAVGAGYTGPAVSAGKVYLIDRVAEGDHQPSAKLATIPGSERVLCLDAETGKELWVHSYPCKYERVSYGFGPRTTPTIVGDDVYTLGTMGDLLCLNAKTGKVTWSRQLRTELKAPVPIWGWSAHPLIDGDRLYCLVGGEKQAVMCFDRKTGKEIWGALTTQEIGYAPPIIIEAGGKRQLIVWHSESINSLNPETGEKYWTIKYPIDVPANRPAAPISVPRFVDDLLFVTSFYHGPIAVRLNKTEPKAEIAWRSKTDDFRKVDGLRSLMSTPAVKDGHIYGICRNGELRCCRLADGKELWDTLDLQKGKPAQFGTSFLVEHRDRYFVFTDTGDLIIAKLSPKGYEEIGRSNIIKPTQPNSGRDVVWSHPAFANGCVFVRNDQEIVCVSLKK